MNPFHGRHFQGEIILWAVRWYCKYGISYRELQEMLAERGVNVDHTTIYRWVQRYAPEMEKRLRWYWRNPTDLHSWHMDETYIKVKGDGLTCIVQLINVVIRLTFTFPLDGTVNQPIVF
jgi:IS6 family transposase